MCSKWHVGESFQITGPSEGPVAESVFIAGMFVKYGREYAELCDHLHLTEEAASARTAIDAVEQATLTAGWDGAWFRRAYDAFGSPVGSRECDEGQIFIEPQGMCVMAGIGRETGQAEAALKSVSSVSDAVSLPTIMDTAVLACSTSPASSALHTFILSRRSEQAASIWYDIQIATTRYNV